MRKNLVVNYLLGDQLGSTSIVTNAAGSLQAETRYKPCPYRVLREGEVRWTTENATLPTRYTFTGQYSYISDDAIDLSVNNSFGLMFYNARWYDPMLGRFAQADSIVPGGVQGLDRYAYAANNPMRYTDPTGHVNQDQCNPMKNYGCTPPITPGGPAPVPVGLGKGLYSPTQIVLYQFVYQLSPEQAAQLIDNLLMVRSLFLRKKHYTGLLFAK